MGKFAKSLTALVAVTLCSSALTACAPATASVDIVTTTNVWADITQTIAGDNFTVQAIISSPNQDPHSYEASPRDQLLISKAKLVIAACNETDSFIKQLVKTETNLLCLDTRTEAGANPHIWYDLGRTLNSVQSIKQALVDLAPNREPALTENFQTFVAELKEVSEYATDPAQITPEQTAKKTFTAIEPVANELFLYMGFKDQTPASVIQAGLNETDLSPSQLEELKRATAQAGIFAYNQSQASVQSDQIETWLAEQQNPARAVGFSEQLPAGLHYLEWMHANAGAVFAALSPSTVN